MALKNRERKTEAIFAQLTVVVSLLLGPVTTAIIITVFSPENQGHYYVLTTLGALIGILHLGDVEAAIVGIDRPNQASFAAAVLGLMFWRFVVMALTFLIVLLIAHFSRILGTSAHELGRNAIYFLFITTNALVAVPHQLSQALLAPYWKRRFYEFAAYSVVLTLGLYLSRDTTALIVAVGASILANLIFSAGVLRHIGYSSLHGFGSPQHAVAFWRTRILPRQKSVGLAHFYSQVGYRLLVPIASESLGVVFAGRVGATISVLGFSLGLLQQRLRVRFPELVRVQSRASHARASKLRRLEYKASVQIGLGVIAFGIIMLAGLALLSHDLVWIRDRFLSSEEILVASFVVAAIGVVGVNAVFRFVVIPTKRHELWLFIAIAVAAALPMVATSFIGVLGFWVGALVGPALILLFLHNSSYRPKPRVS